MLWHKQLILKVCDINTQMKASIIQIKYKYIQVLRHNQMQANTQDPSNIVD